METWGQTEEVREERTTVKEQSSRGGGGAASQRPHVPAMRGGGISLGLGGGAGDA